MAFFNSYWLFCVIHILSFAVPNPHNYTVHDNYGSFWDIETRQLSLFNLLSHNRHLVLPIVVTCLKLLTLQCECFVSS